METLLHRQIEETFCNGGLLNRVFDEKFAGNPDAKYGRRDDQVNVSLTIANSLAKTEELGRPHHAVIEAGTGTGKSFAELVPFAFKIAEENKDKPDDEKKRVLIVTFTTALQRQLYVEDIPDVQKVLSYKGMKVNAVLLKGKGNYICTKRLMDLGKILNSNDPEAKFKAGVTEEDENAFKSLMTLDCDAESNLMTGDREALNSKPSDEFWSKICGDIESDCDSCPYAKGGCYYKTIRESAANADIIIGNHASLMNDLVLRWKTGKGGAIPVDYHYLAIDECHHVEHMLVEQFSTSVSSKIVNSIKRKISFLKKENVKAGMTIKAERITAVDNSFKKFADEANKIFDFFKKVSYGKSISWDHKVTPNDCSLKEATDMVIYELAEILARLDSREDRKLSQKIDGIIKVLNETREKLLDFAFHTVSNDLFYWIDNDTNGVITLKASPLDANKMMREVLFDRIPVTMMSATIKLGPNLNLFADKIGDLKPDEFEQLCVKSPFDYKKNAVFYVPPYALSAKGDEEKYDNYCINEMKRLVELAEGRTFLLFTSNQTMQKYRKILEPHFQKLGYPCLVQGDDDRGTLVKKFKEAKGKVVLFGGDSFWEGIDVKTKILSMVVMQKIPFNVPNPLSVAKSTRIKAIPGRDDFLECHIFPAIVKFKQGLGRLIRGTSDRGVVALLDSRILTTNYGKYFIEEIPDGMKKTTNFEDLYEYIDD